VKCSHSVDPEIIRLPWLRLVGRPALLRANGWQLREENEELIDEARRKRELEAVQKYGPINPRTDRRCFIDEAVDELLDALNYSGWSMEKGELPFCDWMLMHRWICLNA